MAWDEFTFQQQFSLESGALHRLDPGLRRPRLNAMIIAGYGFLLTLVRKFRNTPTVYSLVQETHRFVATLPNPIQWLLTLTLLWWAGALIGTLLGLLLK